MTDGKYPVGPKGLTQLKSAACRQMKDIINDIDKSSATISDNNEDKNYRNDRDAPPHDDKNKSKAVQDERTKSKGSRPKKYMDVGEYIPMMAGFVVEVSHRGSDDVNNPSEAQEDK